MKKNLLVAFIVTVCSIGAKAQVTCAPFGFSFTTTDASCPNNNDGSADVTVTGGTAPYLYWWSSQAAVQTSSMNDSLLPGAYSVIVSDLNGCLDTGYVTVASTPSQTPSICMVTCDGGSVNNIIYWDKTLYAKVDSFIIYRETAPLVYSRIGAVDGDSLSEFTDTARSVGPANGDPNIAAYKYKIAILDTCGNISPMSPYHSTVYITDDGLGTFSWALPYSIEGAPNPVNNYILLCDTANVNVWGPVQTVAGIATNAMDPGFAAHSNIANWRVKTLWPISCTPTRATVNTSRSNIKHAVAAVGMLSESDHTSVVVYPNPAAEEVTIGFSPGIKTAQLCIENIMGQVILMEQLNASGNTPISKRIDVSDLAKGVYFINVESNGAKTFRKLIVN